MSKKMILLEIDEWIFNTGVTVMDLKRKDNLTLLVNVGSQAIEIPIKQVKVNLVKEK